MTTIPRHSTAGALHAGPVRPALPRSAVAELDERTCLAYLRGADLGRLAVVGADGVDIFPMNYATEARSILLRSAPGSKLAGLAANAVVAFEVDGLDDDVRWSVVVRGRASRIGDDVDIELSGVERLVTQTPTEKLNYVRITPTSITGRRFRTTG